MSEDNQGDAVSVRLPSGQLERVDDLIDECEYLNRSDFLRSAVRTLIRVHSESSSDDSSGGSE